MCTLRKTVGEVVKTGQWWDSIIDIVSGRGGWRVHTTQSSQAASNSPAGAACVGALVALLRLAHKRVIQTAAAAGDKCISAEQKQSVSVPEEMYICPHSIY